MPAITPASPADAAAITTALDHLRAARRLLRGAGALRAARAVARSMKSTEGAERHVRHRLRRCQVAGAAHSQPNSAR